VIFGLCWRSPRARTVGEWNWCQHSKPTLNVRRSSYEGVVTNYGTFYGGEGSNDVVGYNFGTFVQD
jgi:hypothetical protein